MLPTDTLRRSVFAVLAVCLATSANAQSVEPPVVLGRGPMQLPADDGVEPAPSYYQTAPGDPPRPPAAPSPSLPEPADFLGGGPEAWTSPEGLSSSLQVVLLLTVLSMAPAVLLMTTCYVRIIIVLGLLRQCSGCSRCRPAR